jgi:hypothetical protein
MNYEGLEVAEGTEAGPAWERVVRCQIDDAGRTRLREALLAYCKQDTLALARLLERLRSGPGAA